VREREREREKERERNFFSLLEEGIIKRIHKRVTRKRPRVSEDFPAPVLPTMPTFSPLMISHEMPRSTRSRPSRYLV
jgi:hypothetical protein